MASGLFITFEGPDGCGKTTQVRRLLDALERRRIPHLGTKEPGGTPVGREIRQILLDPRSGDLDPRAETLLFMADRAQHLAEIIRPALKAGKIVVSDRHRDSAVAYQGGGRRLGIDWVEQLNDLVCGDLRPDATVFLDLPVKVSIRRARAVPKEIARGGRGDRFERELRAFHERLYAMFQELIRREPERFLVIDATGSIDEVTNLVFSALARRFPRHLDCL